MTDHNMSTEERVERLWVTPACEVFREKPKTILAVEYVRVLSPSEWEHLARRCGDIDMNQHLARLHDKLDAQRREITRLHETIKLRDRENAALADSYLSKVGIRPEDLR